MAQLSRARIGGYFARGDSAITTKEKGDALEDLIVYLFEQVPVIGGIPSVPRRSTSPSGTIDCLLDCIFFPIQSWSNVKNWSHPVDYNTLVGFDAILRSRAQSLGILVAASGITGNPTFSSDAYSVVTNAVAQQRRLIVIRFKTKLCQLAATGTIVL